MSNVIKTRPLAQVQITIKYLKDNRVQHREFTLAVRDEYELEVFETDARTYTEELLDISTRVLVSGVN